MNQTATKLFFLNDSDKSGFVSREEFERILDGLRQKHEEVQEEIKQRRPLAERQAQLEQEKERVLAHIASFSERFTVSVQMSEPDEAGNVDAYHRVDMHPKAKDAAISPVGPGTYSKAIYRCHPKSSNLPLILGLLMTD